MKQALFHAIGFSSAISLLMLAILITPGAIQGDYEIIGLFFETYPGSEPFIIFFTPVIFICGIAWVWRMIYDWKISQNHHA